MTHANDLARMISEALPAAPAFDVYKTSAPTLVEPNLEIEGYPNRDGTWEFHVVTGEGRGFRVTVEREADIVAYEAVA